MKLSKGFTLVELAIVLTIIGLLIGGILKGQEMLTNARINATVAQIQSYNAAVIAFGDVYDALPGDLRNASMRIPNCTLGCQTTNTGGRQGDGIVGLTAWNGDHQIPGVFPAMSPGDAVASSAGYEVVNFWMHLLLAGFIGGVSDDGLRTSISMMSFNEMHPSAPIGGGFQTGFADGSSPYGTLPTGGAPMPRDLMLVLTNHPVGSINVPYESARRLLSPQNAQRIDQKIDDGRPGTGIVRASGGASAAGGTGCYVTGSNEYNSGGGSIACFLLIAMRSIST